MLTGQTPILVLKEGTKREKGRGALSNNIAAAKAIADSVRSTLGPRGLDKMLVDSMGDVVVTNDGVTILKEMDVEHPAAKMLVEVAKTQDQEAGDGTTTAVVLTGELLKRAEVLIEQNIHPTIICQGYRLASAKALEILDSVAQPIKIEDHAMLKEIADTAMASKAVSFNREILGEIAVKAVTSVAEKKDKGYYVDLDNIQLIKKQGGQMSETQLIEGVIVDKEKVHSGMPTRVSNPKIALLDAALEIKKTEIDAKIEINDPSQLNAFLQEEENMLRRMVEQVKKSGANVVFCQKGIDDLAQHFLAKEGIYGVRRVKKSDMEKLAKATGANIVSKVSELTADDVGAPARSKSARSARIRSPSSRAARRRRQYRSSCAAGPSTCSTRWSAPWTTRSTWSRSPSRTASTSTEAERLPPSSPSSCVTMRRRSAGASRWPSRALPNRSRRSRAPWPRTRASTRSTS